MADGLILDLRDVAYRYAGAAADVLDAVSLALAPGMFQAVLGPNGSGKTTLVRVALGVLPPRRGSARLLGQAAANWSRRDLARVVGVVAQREENLFPQRVRETVALGRYPHLSLWGGMRADDQAAVTRALVRCDVAHLADRSIWTLSGGEYQRVRLARALAQEPRLLVLDEPTTSLDVRHEMELFELARGLADEHRLAVLLVTHHLNLAARFADRLLLLSAGRVAAQGAASDVLTRETLTAVFGWPVAVERFENQPQVVPLRTRKGNP